MANINNNNINGLVINMNNRNFNSLNLKFNRILDNPNIKLHHLKLNIDKNIPFFLVLKI